MALVQTQLNTYRLKIRTMKRTFQKSIRSSDKNPVLVALTFPENAFPGAPSDWSPGKDFEVTLENRVWRRDNPGGTVTLVVAPVYLPRPDAQPEVWTVTTPSGPLADSVAFDKPSRITRVENYEEALRSPYPGHPTQRVHRYWEEFESRWRFRPERIRGGISPFPMRWVAFEADPYEDPDALDILEEKVLEISRNFPVSVHTYRYDHSRGRFEGILGDVYGKIVPSQQL